MVIVRLENVSKSYGNVTVFKDVTLSFDEKSIYGIVAPNGYGKTTLLKIILGILKPDSGKVSLNVKRISYLPQDAEPIGVMSAVDYIVSYLTLRGLDLRRAKQKALEILGYFNVPNKEVDEMSGGQKQRVLLSAVLSFDADLYLLDEPLTYLDIEGITKLKGIIKKIKEDGKTVIISSPTLTGIIDILDKVLIITKSKRFLRFSPEELVKEAEGKVVVDSDEILKNCYQLYRKNYLCDEKEIIPSYNSIRKANVDDIVAKVVFYE
jgi:ABC-2 type transport system ATP-binding protein